MRLACCSRSLRAGASAIGERFRDQTIHALDDARALQVQDASDVDKLIRVLKLEAKTTSAEPTRQRRGSIEGGAGSELDGSFRKAVYMYQTGESGSSLRATKYFVPPDARWRLLWDGE